YILFPNAFTPNNDGLNDRYKPSVVGTLQSYELIIYNRYGQPVFRSKDPNDGWNGSFKNSSKPLAGTYVWFCRYRFNGGQPLQEKGTFMLIR
ncbi:MAG TPA: gliding motility-associated C-terminal domain-containing protein, partial [Ferruginibacter sp.]|nr:gliding motility-associated C-terminal domain-containing protein [Ferruginibacter sp.]